MSGLLRNAPCPCGSGRKYKQCCLRHDEEVLARRRHRDQGAAVALDWLTARYPREYEAAVMDGFFGALGDAEREAIGDLDAHARDTIDQDIGEWLLADGVLELETEAGKVERRVADLALGADGPALAPAQRALLEALRDTPLRLFEVSASTPAGTLTLRDALEPAAATELHDPFLAATLAPGEYAGLRLLAQDGGPETSGALYGFSAAAGAEVVARLRDELAAFAVDAAGEEAALRRQTITEVIVDHWLAGLTGGLQEPAPGGDPHGHATGAAPEKGRR